MLGDVVARPSSAGGLDTITMVVMRSSSRNRSSATWVDMTSDVGRQITTPHSDAVQHSDPGTVEQREHVLGTGT